MLFCFCIVLPLKSKCYVLGLPFPWSMSVAYLQELWQVLRQSKLKDTWLSHASQMDWTLRDSLRDTLTWCSTQQQPVSICQYQPVTYNHGQCMPLLTRMSDRTMRSNHSQKMVSGWVVLLQRGVYDWVALSLGLAASVRPASDTLTSGRPPQVLCTLTNYILLILKMVISFAMYWGCMAWLTTRPWFTGGNGTSYQVSHCTL